MQAFFPTYLLLAGTLLLPTVATAAPLACPQLFKPLPTQLAGERLQEREWGGGRLEKLSKNSANPVYTVHDDSGHVLAVFKPGVVGVPRDLKSLQAFLVHWDLPRFRFAYEPAADLNRDEAYFRLSEAIGFHIAPKSGRAVSQTGAHGSVQEFLNGYREGRDSTPEALAKVNRANAQKLFLLDSLVTSQDRHPGNWMVNEEGHLLAIDNGFTLPNVPKPRWSHLTDIPRYLPQALGAVDPEVSQLVQHFSAKQLDEALRGVGVPPVAQRFAEARLAALQDMLKSGATLEEIHRYFHQTALVSNKKLEQTAILFGVGGAATGAGWYASEKLNTH